MLRYLFFIVFITLTRCSDIKDPREDELKAPPASDKHELPVISEPDSDFSDYDFESTIQTIERLVTAMDQRRFRETILPLTYIQTQYGLIEEKLTEIIDSITHNTNNAYRFLNAKGIDRIIVPYFDSNYGQIKKPILTLIKTLFEVTPTTTNVVMPMYVIDKMLDVFENDDKSDLKSLFVDILYMWLPNNPKLQARIMKLKGLEPFYKQISKLDIVVNHKLLDLFNKILQEHLFARDAVDPQPKMDYTDIKRYQMIGLIERMSTPMVCNGLLNIFEMIFNTDNKHISLPMFDLVKNVKPLCLKIYTGKDKAIKIFEDFNNYISNVETVSALEDLGLNVTDMKEDVLGYVGKLKEHVRTEL